MTEKKPYLDVMGPMKCSEALRYHCSYRHSVKSFFQSRMVDRIRQVADQGKLPLVMIVGSPGAGKSTLLNAIEEGLNDEIPDLDFTRQTFEEHGMKPARQAHLIHTKPNEERKKEEVEIMSGFFLRNVIRNIQAGKPLIMEIPVTTALPFYYLKDDRNQWIPRGVNAGLSTLLTLLDEKNPYKLPPFRLIFLGLIAGRALREFTEAYREEIKITKSLEEGRRVASLYKRPIPETVPEWQLMKLEGAPVATMQMYKRETAQLSVQLMHQRPGLRREILSPSAAPSLTAEYEAEIRQETYIFKYYRTRVLSDRETIDLRDFMVGYNSPSEAALYSDRS